VRTGGGGASRGFERVARRGERAGRREQCGERQADAGVGRLVGQQGGRARGAGAERGRRGQAWHGLLARQWRGDRSQGRSLVEQGDEAKIDGVDLRMGWAGFSRSMGRL
jgi:hypothetical protein